MYNAYIRRVDNLFVAGKQEPIVRMYNPDDNNFIIMKHALPAPALLPEESNCVPPSL